jgi:outer membrane immunogenic protein
MKRFFLATLSVLALSGAARAADMALKSPHAQAAAMTATVSNWSGFYVGGNLGYGWGNGNTDFSFLPTPADFLLNNGSLGIRSTGVIGGAQFGYNWQIGSLVTGLEADIQGSGIKGSVHPALTDAAGFLNVVSSEHRLSWFGTVRGRLGVTVTPDLLLYGTGGLAYGHVDASANDQVSTTAVINAPASVSKTTVGWTAGAGAEWMFAHNWSAKLEYLYVDLGSESEIGSFPPPTDPKFKVGYTWHTQENIARVGVNYHFN